MSQADREQYGTDREDDGGEQDEVEHRASRLGEVFVTRQEGGEIEVAGEVQPEAAEHEGYDGDESHGGHSVDRLLGEDGHRHGDEAQQNHAHHAQGLKEHKVLMDGHVPPNVPEDGETLDGGRSRGEGIQLGELGVVEVAADNGHEGAGGHGDDILGGEQLPPSSLGGAEDARHTRAVLGGKEHGAEHQGEDVEQVVKAPPEHLIPACGVDEVGIMSRLNLFQQVISAGLHDLEHLVPGLGVLQLTLVLHVLVIGNEAVAVVGLHLLLHASDSVDLGALVGDEVQLFLGDLTLQHGHVLLVEGVREGVVDRIGGADLVALDQQNSEDEQDILARKQHFVKLKASKAGDEARQRHVGDLEELFPLPQRASPRRAAVEQSRPDAENRRDQSHEQENGGEVGQTAAEHVDGVVAGEADLGVHDGEDIQETQGAVDIQIVCEVDKEVHAADDKSREVGHGVVAEQEGGGEDHRSQREQGQNLDDKGQTQILTYGDDVGAEQVIVKDLNVIGQGREAELRPEQDQGGGREGQHGDDDHRQHGGELSQHGGQPSPLGGTDDGVSAVLLFVQQKSRDEDKQKQDEADIAVGVGEIVVPANVPLDLQRDVLSNGINVDDVILIAVVVAVLAHAEGHVLDLGGLGAGNDLVVFFDAGHVYVIFDVTEIAVGTVILLDLLPNFVVVLGPVVLNGQGGQLHPVHHGVHGHLHLYLGEPLGVGIQGVHFGEERLGILLVAGKDLLNGGQLLGGQVCVGGERDAHDRDRRQDGIDGEHEEEEKDNEAVAENFFDFIAEHNAPPFTDIGLQNVSKHVKIVVLQRRHHRHRILGGLYIGQNTQNDPLLAVLNVDHAELLLHGLHILGGYHGLPDLTLDLLGQLVGTAAVRDHALFQHDGLAGDELHVGNHVGSNDNGLIQRDAGDVVTDSNSLLGVKARGRLVENHDFGVTQERLGQGKTLLHTTRKGTDAVGADVVQFNRMEKLVDLLVGFLFVQPLQNGHVTEEIQSREGGVHTGILGHEAQLFAVGCPQLADGRAVQQNIAVVGFKILGDDVHEGGFS